MIIGGPAAYESKRQQKLMDREVNKATLGDAISAFLKCFETVITFDIKDHSDHIPQLVLHSTESYPDFRLFPSGRST